MELLQFFGRFHPVVLHLPIGFFVLVLGMEIADRRNNKDGVFDRAILFGLKWSMWSALLAAGLGWFLSISGSYSGPDLGFHQWLGSITAVTISSLYLIKKKRKYLKWYGFLLWSSAALIILTGHFGGNLTHGRDYILAYAPEPVRALLGNNDSTSGLLYEKEELGQVNIFSGIIQPVLEQKCVSCHNPGKTKGDLQLHSYTALLNGGETGDALVPGDAENSLLYQRLRLPLTEKEHMPPRGKRQLMEEEIQLIRWWIGEGCPDDLSVAASNADGSIMDILYDNYVKKEGVYGLDIEPASQRRINNLQKKGIKTDLIAEDNPFLSVNFSGRKDLTVSTLKSLKNLRNQLTYLDLGNSNVTDGMLAVLRQLPNLTTLHLENTEISDATVKRLKDHQYLEYLNLYDTRISKESIEHLAKIKSLKQVYLWKTNLSDEDIDLLARQLPGTDIISSLADDPIFSEVELKPPLIVADNDLFSDSMQVELKLNFGEVDIRYTLDGSAPDSTSNKYSEPILIEKTTHLQAVAFKGGWKPSETVDAWFVKIRYEPVSIQLARPPNPKYAAAGAKSLIDLKKGTEQFGDGKWLGWEKEHLTAVLDLGEVREVTGLTIGALENTQAWIFFPKGLKVWTSANGRQYQIAAEENYPVAAAPTNPQTKNFTTSFDPVEARYVKVVVESNLTNPDWHPGARQACWVFVDEILVE